MKKRLPVFIGLMLAAVLFAGMAEANGTLTATFMYNGSGVGQPLSGAYVYLHAYPPLGAPIMQKYFRNAQYVFGPTGANGSISASVPNGIYRVRLVRRAPLGSTPTVVYGPPNPGDYTWYSPGSTITVSNGSVSNLGAIYATIFGAPSAPPVSITGQVTDASGTPRAGWFVIAAESPCIAGYYYWGVATQCGIKHPAPQLTGQNGNYTIKLSSPGTYYLYAMPSPAYGYNAWQAFPAATCSSCMDMYGTYWSSCSQCITTGSWAIACYPYCPVSVGSGGQLTGVNINYTPTY
ncbi:MAG: hypothetical protein M0Z48_05000 [Nitrospiraceae bacterium]|nr:hypothetical protein [Nitrospiraceae bacterium]